MKESLTLCDALIQPHIDYASQIWLSNLTKALSNKVQCAQNKCIRFCLQLGNRARLDKKEFKEPIIIFNNTSLIYSSLIK